ncbi:MAG: DUF3592 domain-containing protein [Spirulinaceae cyanobacterium]
MTWNRSTARSKHPILIGFLFSTLGILTLIFCAISYQKTRTFIATANTAEGTVMAVEKSRLFTAKPNSGSSSHPIVRFTTEAGETIEFRSNVGSNPPTYRPGETIPILYPPENPQRATINSFSSLWLLILIFTVVGGSFTISGVSALWWKLTGK